MIQKELIFLDGTFSSREEVFRFLANVSKVNHFSTNEQAVLEALNERESQGTTGMMDGFAIPHAKSDAITEPTVVFIRNANGIEWDSMDGQPIQHILAMFIPEAQQGTTHLQILSKIARMLMKSDVRSQLKQSNEIYEIMSLLEEAVES